MNPLIVIVNYRTADLVSDCLRSLSSQRDAVPDMKVVVTDNASGDDSVRRIQAVISDEGMESWASVVELERNGGFCYGTNAGIRLALAEPSPPRYVLLLNPDTVVRDGAIEALVRFMDEHPQAAIAGSRLEDPDGTPQISAFRFITPLSEFVSQMRLGVLSRFMRRWDILITPADQPHEAPWLSGAAMMVRSTVFETIGLLDEGYFLYFDDVDFCLRAHRAGFRCWYVPQSRIVHLVGKSTGIGDTRNVPPRVPKYWFDSRRHYFVKNFGRLGAAAADLAWLVGHLVWRVRRWIQRKPDRDPSHLAWDFFRYSVWCNGFKTLRDDRVHEYAK